MPRYLMTYRSPGHYAPTSETTELWWAWFDSMGEQLVEMGSPVTNVTSVGSCDGGGTELGGYSIIEAEDVDAALRIAKGCPHLDQSGGVELGQLVDVHPRLHDAATTGP
jgi:hypothetical protein